MAETIVLVPKRKLSGFAGSADIAAVVNHVAQSVAIPGAPSTTSVPFWTVTDTLKIPFGDGGADYLSNNGFEDNNILPWVKIAGSGITMGANGAHPRSGLLAGRAITGTGSTVSFLYRNTVDDIGLVTPLRGAEVAFTVWARFDPLAGGNYTDNRNRIRVGDNVGFGDWRNLFDGTVPDTPESVYRKFTATHTIDSSATEVYMEYEYYKAGGRRILQVNIDDLEFTVLTTNAGILNMAGSHLVGFDDNAVERTYIHTDDVDDVPVDGVTEFPISSNWAFDHVAAPDPHVGYVLESLFDAQTVLHATSDDTPVALAVTEQTLVGRQTSGNIAAIPIGITDDDIVEIDDADVADDDYAKFTTAGLEGRSYAEVLSDLSGQADATFDWNNQTLTDLAGLVTDTGTPRDLPIDCGAQKTVILSRVVFDDMQFPVSSGRVPAANAPTFETFTANTRSYAFDVDDFIFLQANEMPHWWNQGSDGESHVHFAIKTAQSTGSDRFAKFTLHLAVADVNEIWSELGPFTAEATIPTGSGALLHFRLDLGSVTLTNVLINAQLTARITRIAATGGTEYADDVYITQVGMHLQKDTMGSRQEKLK